MFCVTELSKKIVKVDYDSKYGSHWETFAIQNSLLWYVFCTRATRFFVFFFVLCKRTDTNISGMYNFLSVNWLYKVVGYFFFSLKWRKMQNWKNSFTKNLTHWKFGGQVATKFLSETTKTCEKCWGANTLIGKRKAKLLQSQQQGFQQCFWVRKCWVKNWINIMSEYGKEMKASWKSTKKCLMVSDMTMMAS